MKMKLIQKNTTIKYNHKNFSSTFTFLDKQYEIYNLELSLQNNLCAAVMFVLSDMFRILTVKEQHSYIKSLKYKMYIELSEKNLHKQFGYNKKRIKKNDLESQLMNYELLNVIGQNI